MTQLVHLARLPLVEIQGWRQIGNDGAFGHACDDV